MDVKPTPTEMVEAMVAQASAAETLDDLAAPGTFSGQYGEAIRDDLNGDNIEAFIHGSAIVNLLIQECILRITTIADNQEPESDLDAAYARGIKEGAMMVATLMGNHADALIQDLIEEPVIHQRFNQIIANF